MDWYIISSKTEGFYHQSVLERIRLHRKEGTSVVFVSGSFAQILKPIADALSVTDMLCAPLVEVDGAFTGELGYPQTIGDGKALAITKFLSDRNVASQICWAYGDDISDVPMLSAVGHPVAIEGDAQLMERAKNYGWEVMSL